MSKRLDSQMRFLDEIEKLKVVYRQNRTVDRSRPENSAEHSWHVALMAIVLFEYADDKSLNLAKIVSMLLIHDLVEIYAGDTWAYDVEATVGQAAREQTAAERIFSMLPADQAKHFQSLWAEFEARSTPDAAFAASIDALQPLSNHLRSGSTEGDYKPIEQQRILDRKRHIGESSSTLWELAQQIIRDSSARGLYC